MAIPRNRLLLTALLSILVSFALAHGQDQQKKEVTYDGKSLIINGRHELLFSGSVHYTRSPPEMWPDILDKARHGGLNVIQTYVFWNVHEPEQGKWNFEGNYDLVKFLKLVQQEGMYATLRLGPFIQAEWNHGGLPYWLREVPDIIFRTDNEPFKFHMERYVSTVIDKMKAEKMFFSQGGPIILAQIENEYNHVQATYEAQGASYIQWAANLAVSKNVGVPWIMCKQTDAPDPVINACNGRQCGDTFSGPNKPYKPSIWTENWTAQYRVFGDPPSQRSAEDLAFSVARFFSKNGSLVNYYMYHGGTNFGRTSSAFTATRYYDEAPLDEYGLQKEPKWGHLRDLHRALNLCKKALLGGTPSVTKLSEKIETRVFEKPESGICAAFLANNHTQKGATVNFRGQSHFLPPHSISILPDCKTVVYNTQMVASQHNSRNFKRSQIANSNKWEVFTEAIPTTQDVPVNQDFPQELYGLLKDTTDYAWYTTSIVLSPEDMPRKKGVSPVLRIISLGHSLVAFVNGEYLGTAHGSHDEKSFVFEQSANLKVGVNHISILASTVGLPDSGAYMEHRYAGPKSINILGLNSGTIDLTNNGWGHQVGLKSEKLGLFTEDGSEKVQWKPINGRQPALSWYKRRFDAPEGKDPVAIRMNGMGKGMVWINGNNIGRYWISYLSPLGQPSQSEYHIPIAWLKDKDNLVVVLEEAPATPEEIEVLTVNRDTICSYITDYHPPSVKSWGSKSKKFQSIVEKAIPGASLKCPNQKRIVNVDFVSFGNPKGFCGGFTMGNCSVTATKQIVEQQCLGKMSCSIPMDPKVLLKNGDVCPNIRKTLAIQVTCSS
ncbi:hypothetical protein QN277_001631 [Acacia crassicarpa]|uniref:Beta-galactosidase n=1 Tax=Acacia crassicarpa TaxID=499986 RepID=A0AAE1TH05_9FABA|nr:hypothetical protein QN277_001631 [Acacia crassicarpa]